MAARRCVRNARGDADLSGRQIARSVFNDWQRQVLSAENVSFLVGSGQDQARRRAQLRARSGHCTPRRVRSMPYRGVAILRIAVEDLLRVERQ